VLSIASNEARTAFLGASTFCSQSSRAISRAVARLPIVDCRRRIPAAWATACERSGSAGAASGSPYSRSRIDANLSAGAVAIKA
jgi:hypothetical protein